jgi:hypothetical protein
MINTKQEIPYFIKIGGCNNCRVAQAYVTKTGTFYEEGHALHAKCIHMGCIKYGHSVEEPFITPQEFIRIGTDLCMLEVLDKAKKIIVKFFDFYDSKGGLLPWVIEAIAQESDEKPFHTKVAKPIS